MKKYKKSPTKLFQIRVSEGEYKTLMEVVNKTGMTRREWIMQLVKKEYGSNL